MAARSGQKVKLLTLVEILKKYTDEDHPMSAGELIERLAERGVTAERKSVYDDIAVLCDYGYDIVHTRVPDSGYFLASREFELPEIYLLADAVRSAKFISTKKSRDLVAKLDGMISVHQARLREKGIYMSTDRKSTNEELFYIIDTISNAISARQKITLNYSVRQLSENREVVHRTKQMKISPYAMIWQDDHYYLIGNYEKYENLLHLRIDRMRKVEIAAEKARPFGDVCEYREHFDTADYAQRLFGMQGGESAELELRCKNSLIEQVLDRFGDDIFIRNVSADSFVFSSKVALSEGLVTWLMNYGDSVTVLAPKSLAAKLRDRAQKILSLYQ